MNPFRGFQTLSLTAALAAAMVLAGCDSSSSDDDEPDQGSTDPGLSEEVVRPIVFVHGGPAPQPST